MYWHWKKRFPIEVLTLLVINCNILYAFFILILLISCGDTELNPGPIVSFAEAKTKCNADKKNLKIFQVNYRSIVNKRRALNEIVGELPENTIFFVLQRHGSLATIMMTFITLRKTSMCVLDLTERKRAFRKRAEV